LTILKTFYVEAATKKEPECIPYVFNRFLHVRYIHAYAYATCNNVSEISLITKKHFRYYFKVMSLFETITDSFFKKGHLERAKAWKAARIKGW